MDSPDERDQIFAAGMNLLPQPGPTQRFAQLLQIVGQSSFAKLGPTASRPIGLTLAIRISSCSVSMESRDIYRIPNRVSQSSTAGIVASGGCAGRDGQSDALRYRGFLRTLKIVPPASEHLRATHDAGFTQDLRRPLSPAWRSSLDESGRPIYAVGDDRRIVYCNASLASWLGTERSQIVGRFVEYHSVPAETTESRTASGCSPIFVRPQSPWRGRNVREPSRRLAAMVD